VHDTSRQSPLPSTRAYGPTFNRQILKRHRAVTRCARCNRGSHSSDALQIEGFHEIKFCPFIDTLLLVLTESQGVNPDKIAVRVAVEPVRSPIGTAVPCGRW
jgi:hypothetical protein